MYISDATRIHFLKKNLKQIHHSTPNSMHHLDSHEFQSHAFKYFNCMQSISFSNHGDLALLV